jgi:hypothetical protein
VDARCEARIVHFVSKELHRGSQCVFEYKAHIEDAQPRPAEQRGASFQLAPGGLRYTTRCASATRSRW